MRNPLARVSAVATPQSRPIPGRDQVRNAAGGYVFAKDVWTQVEDFLILGTTGGTYYVSDDKLTETNVDVLFQTIAEDGSRLVSLITAISTARPPRAPKPSPALFALAAAAAKGDPATVQAVKAAFPQVVRTTDHLAMFFGYWKNLAGKAGADGRRPSPVIGRAMRTTLGSYFTTGDIRQVAFRAIKARQRATPAGEAMALRDVIRISHPTGPTPAHGTLIGWLAGKVSDDEARAALSDVDDFLTAQAATTPAEAVAIIRDRRVPWEFLPSDLLADKDVWTELTQTMGLTALIRNLARMTRIGTLAPFTEANRAVMDRLANGDALARARVHPMDLFLALKAYSSGRSQPAPGKPALTWQPVGVITDALANAYEMSFGAVEPSGRRLLVAVDSSASMSRWSQVVSGGSPLGTAYEVANAMALMLARIEGPNVHVIDVDTVVHSSRITPRTSLGELATWWGSGGGTDMSLPFSWALDRRLAVDGVVVMTDNETWAGRQHPVQALEAYRRSVNPRVRVVVVSMTATGVMIAESADEGVLNVAGLDSSLPRLITGFVR
jgi:60 kDa SS-A/Ro ribonucleoprotein